MLQMVSSPFKHLPLPVVGLKHQAGRASKHKTTMNFWRSLCSEFGCSYGCTCSSSFFQKQTLGDGTASSCLRQWCACCHGRIHSITLWSVPGDTLTISSGPSNLQLDGRGMVDALSRSKTVNAQRKALKQVVLPLHLLQHRRGPWCKELQT